MLAGAAEVCHFACGLPLLLSLGALGACSLGSASPEARHRISSRVNSQCNLTLVFADSWDETYPRPSSRAGRCCCHAHRSESLLPHHLHHPPPATHRASAPARRLGAQGQPLLLARRMPLHAIPPLCLPSISPVLNLHSTTTPTQIGLARSPDVPVRLSVPRRTRSSSA